MHAYCVHKAKTFPSYSKSAADDFKTSIKNMNILYKWLINYWIKLKILSEKLDNFLFLSNFSFCHNVFKGHQKTPVWRRDFDMIIDLMQQLQPFLENEWHVATCSPSITILREILRWLMYTTFPAARNSFHSRTI